MAQTISLLGNWDPQGHKYGHRMVCDSGLPLSTKVKDVFAMEIGSGKMPDRISWQKLR